MSDLGDLVTNVGSAVGDLFGAQGHAAEANSFNSAATLATQNAQLTAASTRIQETQTARQLFQTEGAQQTDVAGAGFTESGSALDLLRSTASQGALAKSLVNIQGAISENSYAAQAGAYEGEAAAANEASQAGVVSAIGAIGGALLQGGSLAAKDYTAISGLFSTGSSETIAANGADLFSGLSLTDQSVSSGASLFDASNADASASFANSLGLASGTATVDTSGIAIGTSADAASAGAADAASAGAVDAAAGLSTFGTLGAAGVAGFVGSELAKLLGADEGTSDAVGIGVGLGALAILFTVVCTALYKTGDIEKEVWVGSQVYGRTLSQETMDAYRVWGIHVARAIEKRSKVLSPVLAFIFIPFCEEMAFITGYYDKSSLHGRVVLKAALVFTRLIEKGRAYGYAKA